MRKKIELLSFKLICVLPPQVLMYMDCLHGKWPLDAIKAVFSRRFLLQNCAVEVYTSGGSMFTFSSVVLSLGSLKVNHNSNRELVSHILCLDTCTVTDKLNEGKFLRDSWFEYKVVF